MSTTTVMPSSSGIGHYDVGATTSDAWHRLSGWPLVENIDMDTFLDVFGLDISSQPLALSDGAYVPGVNAVIRTNTDGSRVMLGSVGDRHEVMSYLTQFGGTVDLLQKAGCTVKTIGTMHDGGQGFVSLGLPNDIGSKVFESWSKVDSTLILTSSVNGTASHQVNLATTVAVCTNFYRTVRKHGLEFRSRNTASHEAKIDDWNGQIAKAIQDVQAEYEWLEALANEPFSEADFRAWVDAELYPAKSVTSKAGETRQANKRQKLFAGYANRAEHGGIWGTKLHGLQAVQRHEQHDAEARKGTTVGQKAIVTALTKPYPAMTKFAKQVCMA